MTGLRHGWKTLRQKGFGNLGFTLIELEHQSTGAKWLHVDTNTSHLQPTPQYIKPSSALSSAAATSATSAKLFNPKANVFAVGFKTPVSSSNGVPHVLEHTVLCGSKKYPVRDPFFAMLNRSLAVYMNAFTAQDYTMYPFSTLNLEDYKNLMSVYLDAVFFPKLTHLDFLQEGWRLEPTNALSNADAIAGQVNSSEYKPYELKGIVFNEMKGAMSDPDRIYLQAYNEHLYSATPYSFNSGGDPHEIITNLDHAALKDFHAKYYRPSNAYFYTYGSFDLEVPLEFVSSQLQDFKGHAPARHSAAEQPLQGSKESMLEDVAIPKANPIEVLGPLNTMIPQDSQITSSFGWKLPKMDEYGLYKHGLLSPLLLNGSNAPFYKSLIATKIGSDYAPNTGFDVDGAFPSFAVGLQGLSEKNLRVMEDAVFETLEHVAETGLEHQRIRAIIHQVELVQKVEKASFGLELMSALMPHWLRERDIFQFIDYSDFNSRIYHDLNDKEHVRSLIEPLIRSKDSMEKNFTPSSSDEGQAKNTMINLIMRPDEEFSNKLLSKEDQILQQMVLKLSNQQKEEIIKNTSELKDLHSSKPDISCLPLLPIATIDRKSPSTQFTTSLCNGPEEFNPKTTLMKIPQLTKGVIFFRAAFNFENLPPNLMPYLPIFTSFITQIGTLFTPRLEFDDKIKLISGGIKASISLNTSSIVHNAYQANFVLSTHALKEHMEELLPAMLDLIRNPDFNDLSVLESILSAYYTNLSTGVADSGHQYAMSLAGESLSERNRLSETLQGISHINFVKGIHQDKNFTMLREKLIQLSQVLFNPVNFKACVTADEHELESFEQEFEKFYAGLVKPNAYISICTKSGELQACDTAPDALKKWANVYRKLDLNVNYVSKALEGAVYLSKDFAALKVLSNIITAKYLHRRIREEGGAYGAGLACTHAGLSFYSYRDPNVARTLGVYDGTYDWVFKAELSDEDIHEAKLLLFQKIDAPVSPGNKGVGYFLSDLNDETKQRFRAWVLDANRVDLLEAAEKYLKRVDQRPAVVLGPLNVNQDLVFYKDQSWCFA